MFNCAAGREEHCKQMSLVCVGSARNVWVTLGLPLLTACVLSPSTLLRLQVALPGNFLGHAPSCMDFPDLRCSGSGSQVLHKGRLSWTCILCPSQVQVAQATRCLASAHSPGVVCLIASPVPAAQFPGWCVSSGELTSGCHSPDRCQPSRIPGRLG